MHRRISLVFSPIGKNGTCIMFCKPVPLVANITTVLLLAIVQACPADELDDYIVAAMSRQHIPGLSLAIMHKSTLIKVKAYGLANIELNVPAQPETVYELTSARRCRPQPRDGLFVARPRRTSECRDVSVHDVESR